MNHRRTIKNSRRRNPSCRGELSKNYKQFLMEKLDRGGRAIVKRRGGSTRVQLKVTASPFEREYHYQRILAG